MWQTYIDMYLPILIREKCVMVKHVSAPLLINAEKTLSVQLILQADLDQHHRHRQLLPGTPNDGEGLPELDVDKMLTDLDVESFLNPRFFSGGTSLVNCARIFFGHPTPPQMYSSEKEQHFF